MRALRSSIRIAQVDGKYVPALIAPIHIVDAQIAVCVMYVDVGRACGPVLRCDIVNANAKPRAPGEILQFSPVRASAVASGQVFT